MIFSDSYLLDTEQWSWSTGPKIKYDGSSGADVPGGQKKRTLHLLRVAKYRGVPLKQ